MVIQHWMGFAWAMGLVLVTSVILKISWYDLLRDYPADIAAEIADKKPAAEKLV